ncbi:MAG TPA: HEAT repeat domain-containing protein [Kofleriaceae bacterium]|nr:HEAT repeat domain-containing protein [Kofleriaceae bacterium]
MKRNIAMLLTATACSLVLVGTTSVADAGRGGSYSRIATAINGGGTATIIAELERAERLVCPSCVQPVMNLLDDDRFEVREVAAWWFARRPAQKAMLHDRSVERLATGDSVQARNAADILGTFRHPQAIAPLAAAMSRSNLSAEARAHIMHALGTIGHKSANPALMLGMQDASADTRLQAVTAWIAIRGQTDAAPALPLIGDSNLLVRRKAAAAVGFFSDGAGRQALEDRLLNDTDSVVRRNAAWALGQIGDAASRGALDQAVNDESSLVRATARAAKRQLR